MQRMDVLRPDMQRFLRQTSRVFCGICCDERLNTMGCFVAANVATCAVFVAAASAAACSGVFCSGERRVL